MTLGTSAAWQNKADSIIDELKDSLINSIQESVRIKSYNNNCPVTPSEGVKKVLDHALDTASKMGMKVYKHPEYRYGWAEIGDKSLKEMVMVLGHLDTVPEGELSDWTEGGPFEGKIVDDKKGRRIIGRGVIDDKGPTLAALYSMKAVMESGAKLGRRIRVFFGTSEDGFGLDGKKWSCVAEYAERCKHGEEEWPVFGFSPDADNFAVTYIEKTGVNIIGAIPLEQRSGCILEKLGGGTAVNAVSDFCSFVIAADSSKMANADKVMSAIESAVASVEWKKDATFKREGNKVVFEVKGVAAHSGQAWKGKNANMRALYILSKIPGAWQNTAQKLVELIGVDTADGEGLGIKQGTTQFDDIITTNMGLLGLENGEECKITFNINTRYPDAGADLLVPNVKHYTGAEIKAKIMSAFKAKGFNVGDDGSGAEVCVNGGLKPYTIPWDSEIVIKLRNAYKIATGVDKHPEIVFGGTYASAWEKCKLSETSDELFGYRMAAWGFEGGGLLHAPNEYVEIDELIKGTKIMSHAMGDLAKAE